MLGELFLFSHVICYFYYTYWLNYNGITQEELDSKYADL